MIRLAVLTAILLFLGGFAWFAGTLDDRAPVPETPTDAIIVLTGGSQRIDAGLSLLIEGKAKKLFVSGVNPGVGTEDMLKVSRATPHWIECCVVLGHNAGNTRGNAEDSAEWLRREGYRSLRLVTANYHMRRALLEFRRVLPPDVVIVAEPVHPEGSAGVILAEYLKYLAALARPAFERDRPA
jgi:uncharacterized SAM-binding protein YcdF (DUF218 family)